MLTSVDLLLWDDGRRAGGGGEDLCRCPANSCGCLVIKGVCGKSDGPHEMAAVVA